MAPIPEAIFLNSCRYGMLSMIRIPRDLEVDTCFIRTLSIEVKWHSDNVLNFCLEPIDISSVLG